MRQLRCWRAVVAAGSGQLDVVPGVPGGQPSARPGRPVVGQSDVRGPPWRQGWYGLARVGSAVLRTGWQGWALLSTAGLCR